VTIAERQADADYAKALQYSEYEQAGYGGSSSRPPEAKTVVAAAVTGGVQPAAEAVPVGTPPPIMDIPDIKRAGPPAGAVAMPGMGSAVPLRPTAATAGTAAAAGKASVPVVAQAPRVVAGAASTAPPVVAAVAPALPPYPASSTPPRGHHPSSFDASSPSIGGYGSPLHGGVRSAWGATDQPAPAPAVPHAAPAPLSYARHGSEYHHSPSYGMNGGAAVATAAPVGGVTFDNSIFGSSIPQYHQGHAVLSASGSPLVAPPPGPNTAVPNGYSYGLPPQQPMHAWSNNNINNNTGMNGNHDMNGRGVAAPMETYYQPQPQWVWSQELQQWIIAPAAVPPVEPSNPGWIPAPVPGAPPRGCSSSHTIATLRLLSHF
jgi:hypothetical protein